MSISDARVYSAFFVSLILAAILSIPVLKLLAKLKARQTVSAYAPEGHQTKQGTPTMGGILVVLASTIASSFFITSTPFTYFLGEEGFSGKSEITIASIVAMILFAMIGFTDDYLVPKLMPGKRGLGWTPKLGMQIMAGLATLACWPRMETPLHYGIGLFLILFVSNAFNFVDGLDGLAGSIGILLCLGFGAMYTGNAMLFAIAGALCVFLFFNAPPAKVFMGDVGSLPIGAVIGLSCANVVVPLAADPIDWGIVGVCALMLGVMFAEIVPVPLQIFWVKVFKKRLFPYTPIHHAFEKAGWPETRVTAMFVLVQLALIFASFWMYTFYGWVRVS